MFKKVLLRNYNVVRKNTIVGKRFFSEKDKNISPTSEIYTRLGSLEDNKLKVNQDISNLQIKVDEKISIKIVQLQQADSAFSDLLKQQNSKLANLDKNIKESSIDLASVRYVLSNFISSFYEITKNGVAAISDGKPEEKIIENSTDQFKTTSSHKSEPIEIQAAKIQAKATNYQTIAVSSSVIIALISFLVQMYYAEERSRESEKELNDLRSEMQTKNLTIINLKTEVGNLYDIIEEKNNNLIKLEEEIKNKNYIIKHSLFFWKIEPKDLKNQDVESVLLTKNGRFK